MVFWLLMVYLTRQVSQDYNCMQLLFLFVHLHLPLVTLFTFFFLRQAVACGIEAASILLARGSQQLHYSSLCVPDDLKERGLDSLPNCYYAQDSLRVWNALYRCLKDYLIDQGDFHHIWLV